MIELVPVAIRSHLIPFFYEEMEGTTASYDGQKVKMIRLLPASSLANYIYTQIGYEKKQVNSEPYDNFLLYLSIQTKSICTLTGIVYIDKKGVKSELKMPLSKVRDFNNLLEDIFRTSLVYFVDGYYYGCKNKKRGMELFVEKYNLDEYGFDYFTIKKIYYDQKKKKLCKRFQTRSTNQVTNYY